MIGCQDFCGYYDWTFEYLRRTYGEEAVRAYWEQAIARDSQQHARELIVGQGFAGMEAYWSHTLAEEEAGYVATRTEEVYRIDMQECPSLGFLIRNNLAAYHDYCNHCMGWIKPIMDEAGFTIDHEHNHRGQCWWEMRRAGEGGRPSRAGELSGERDVRLRPDWQTGRHDLYRNGELMKRSGRDREGTDHA